MVYENILKYKLILQARQGLGRGLRDLLAVLDAGAGRELVRRGDRDFPHGVRMLHGWLTCAVMGPPR